MKKSDTLAGLILCGGESRRMGSDKGLLQSDGKPWAMILGEKLAALNLPLFYSLRYTQVDDYSRYFDGHQLIEDGAVGEGPMRGLLSAHLNLPGTDFLMVACDMHDLDSMLLINLLSAYTSHDFEFYAYREEPFYQTFPAIYTATGIGKWSDSKSLQSMLRCGNTFSLPVTDPAAFRNYNSPE